MNQLTNKGRLEAAFRIADKGLGIPSLLDPEDVDVDKPDEKSIMTYVASFLNKFPEPGTTSVPVSQALCKLFIYCTCCGHSSSCQTSTSESLRKTIT